MNGRKSSKSRRPRETETSRPRHGTCLMRLTTGEVTTHDRTHGHARPRHTPASRRVPSRDRPLRRDRTRHGTGTRAPASPLTPHASELCRSSPSRSGPRVSTRRLSVRCPLPSAPHRPHARPTLTRSYPRPHTSHTPHAVDPRSDVLHIRDTLHTHVPRAARRPRDVTLVRRDDTATSHSSFWFMRDTCMRRRAVFAVYRGSGSPQCKRPYHTQTMEGPRSILSSIRQWMARYDMCHHVRRRSNNRCHNNVCPPP